LRLAQAKGRLPDEALRGHVRDLSHVPAAVARALGAMDRYRLLAERYYGAEHLLFLGRGLAFPVAMEGALKMKEISYIHAEGYAAGEMKHGPIALIDENFPAVAIATKHALRTKLVSNIEQLQARSGPVIAIVTDGDTEIAALTADSIAIPEVPALLEPMVATIPMQCLAYYIALRRGCDVDQPRNLAKTVTVE
jgi:glucosamine--fructose-6-phosphate aminotransferase (isomerizing)